MLFKTFRSPGKIFWLITVLVLYVCGSLAQAQTLENGYTLPKASEENIQKVIQQSVKNLVFVKGGSFMMGDQGYLEEGNPYRIYWSPFDNNIPAHKVTLDSYSISKYEVTFWEYDVYTAATGKKHVGMWFQHQYSRKDNYPVGDVTQKQAQEYCEWVGEKTGLPFSLPTEAQWEYAARNRGKNIGYATDNGKIEPGRNHRDSGFGVNVLNPVGTFPPSPLGLYEMSGNASEWVHDWYDKNYYKHSPEFNPKGPETGTYKITRGGGATNSPSGNDVYGRRKVRQVYPEGADTTSHLSHSYRTSYYYGFRCVVNSGNNYGDIILNSSK